MSNLKTQKDIKEIIRILKFEYERLNKPPLIQKLEKENIKDPFKILIATILSLRTKDTTTAKVVSKLFKKLNKPEDIKKISQKELEELIYPVGFYKRKAKQISDICEILIKKYDSKVPNNEKELLKFKGVGRKTTNLVLAEGFNQDTICVDTHVHRISNRLGFVKTKIPEETETELKKIIPKKEWSNINKYLVAYGQNICFPIKPNCQNCKLKKYCNHYKNR